jgi:hypothetical protein
MKLKMLVGLSGPDMSLSQGDVAEFDVEEAARLVDAGFAVPVKKGVNRAAAPVVETAVEPQVEVAVVAPPVETAVEPSPLEVAVAAAEEVQG